MEFACDWKGVELLSLSRVPDVGEEEQLEWAVMSALPTCDDSCGEGGGCFKKTGIVSPRSEGTSPY